MSVRTPEQRARNTANARTYRERNRAKLNEAARKRRADNPEKARLAHRRWLAKNVERNREDCRRYRAENLERERKRQRDSYAADLERSRAKGRRRYAANATARRKSALKWAAANPDRVHAITARRRARKAKARVESVSRRVVFERDGYVCQICGKPTSGVYPDPLSPSLDHVIPLAKGGEHSYANTQCAHFKCNAGKGPRYEP